MKLSQFCHGMQHLDRCGQWYIQMITFLYEFVLTFVSNLSGSLLVTMKLQRWLVTLSTRRLSPFRASYPCGGGITTSTKSIMVGISSVDSGVGSISSTMPLDLTNVSANLKSCWNLLLGKIYIQNDGKSFHMLCHRSSNRVHRYQHRTTCVRLRRFDISEKIYKL